MMAEISARQGGRLGDDKARAERLLLAADAKSVHAAAREARVLVDQGFVREKKTLASVRYLHRQGRRGRKPRSRAGWPVSTRSGPPISRASTTSTPCAAGRSASRPKRPRRPRTRSGWPGSSPSGPRRWAG